ncbi:hypothetical protein AALD74_04940 [Lachnospiraceae bacterium 48-21]
MALKDAFVLTYDRMCRYQGEWHTERKLIFPANVMLESKDEKLLRIELLQHKNVFNLRQPVLKMTTEEEKLLRFLCGKTRHIEMSRGVIRNGITQVKEGPLKGMESQICKIDRHKRLAKLCAQEGKNIKYVSVGLEIVKKSI